MVTRRKIKRYLKLFLPGIALIFFLFVGTFSGLLSRYPYSEMHPERRLEAPSADFWFGTDAFGRDIYSRVVVGTKVSYSVSVGAVAVAVIGGVLFGVIGGLFKLMGYVVMRFVDVIICFPPFWWRSSSLLW